MFFVGFNSGDLEETVENWVTENYYEGDEDERENAGWGFFEELTLKESNEDIFKNVESDGMQTDIKSTNENINKFVELALENGDVYFNENKEVIEGEEWKKKVETSDNYTISICQYEED